MRLRAAILGMVAALPAAAQDPLPIDRGIYVRAEIPCDQASNADTISYWGNEINSQRTVGTIVSVTPDPTGPHRFKVVTSERDITTDALPSRFEQEIEVFDRRRIQTVDRWVTATYRWCRPIPGEAAAPVPAAPEGRLPPVPGWLVRGAGGEPPGYAICEDEEFCLAFLCLPGGQVAFEIFLSYPPQPPGAVLRLRVDAVTAPLPLPAPVAPETYRWAMPPQTEAALRAGATLGVGFPGGTEIALPLRNSAAALGRLHAACGA